MKKRRTDRLNSLLKEVISEVIKRDVKNRKISDLITVTKVEITKDLHFAKVFISVIGTKEEKEKNIKELEKASGFISSQAAKKVTMRYFPSLTFKLDDSVDKFMQIEKVLQDIKKNEK
jgi:ribosome-binding factor A